MKTGTRSKEVASIVLLGLTGAGKSTTFSKTFGTQMEAVENFTSATSTILENSVQVPIPGGTTKELIVIDTPGFGDTRQRAFERDAQLLATLDIFMKNHAQLQSCYPSVVLLVMKFNDDRIVHETSHFIQMLKGISNFLSNVNLIDKNTCNLIVVLTHVMNEANDQLRKDPTPKIKMIEGLFKEYTALTPPHFVVMAENKPETFNLAERLGYWLLPNGDYYPFNLYQMIDKVTSAGKDTLANIIFREAFKNPAGLKKSLKKQAPLQKVDSPMVNRYFNLLKNSKFKIENTEISIKIQSIWDKLPEHLTANSGSTLQHVQKRFHENGVITNKDLPKTAILVVKIISSLPMSPPVIHVLKELGIQAPEYPDGVKLVGNFYDLAADTFTLTTPFAFPDQELSPAGFMVPVGIKIEELYDDVLTCELFDTTEEYYKYRLKKLKMHKSAPITLLKSSPKSGCNVIDNFNASGVATGIKEIRIYKINTSNPQFTEDYSEYLKTLPKFKPKSKTKVPLWQKYVDKGTHVLKSAYAGGCVTVKAKRNSSGGDPTHPVKLRYIIEKLLDNVGSFNSDNVARNIHDFDFSIEFTGGDKNLARVDISRLYTAEGVQFFKNWEGSLRLHPILLPSEIMVESVGEHLPNELSYVEPNIRLCLQHLMGITHCQEKDGEPVARENIKTKKERDCVLM